MDFFVISGYWYKMRMDEALPRYVLDFERQSIILEANGGVSGGHYARKSIAQKIVQAGLWWPIVHKY